MNYKGIIVIGGIVAVTLLAVLMLAQRTSLPPAIVDNSAVKDESSLKIGDDKEDTPIISDSVKVENQTLPDFYTDENGTRHYVIEATDEPTLG